jgi:hypothetical protein
MIGTTPAAFGSNGFDIVVPSPPGVPIIINGIDASYAAMPLPPQWNPPHHIPLYSTPVIMAVEANHRAARFLSV